MKKVRFLEGCYLLGEKKSYDFNSVAFIDKSLAKRLYDREVVDILNDEECVEDEVKENDLTKPDISGKSVKELQDIAVKHGISYSGLRKAELIDSLKEVF